MTEAETGKSANYLLLIAACAIVFGLSRRIEPLILCAPFVVALVRGLSSTRRTEVSARLHLEKRTAFENEPIRMSVTITTEAAAPLIELMVPLPSIARLEEGSNQLTLSLDAGEIRTYSFVCSFPTRRKFSIPQPVMRTIGAHGFRVGEFAPESVPESVSKEAQAITIYPAPMQLKSLVKPRRTQVYSGNYRSAVSGEGTEWSSVRELLPGDRIASINWRATARRGSFFVNRYVVERNADVVLFMDTFTDTTLYGPTYVDLAARCAASVSLKYIRHKNRVALVEFGHYLILIPPASSLRHWYRLLNTLAGTTPNSRSITYDVSTVPKRILPNHSLVVAFTAMLSERFDSALLDLKQRGFDVATVIIDAVPLVSPASETLSIADDLWRAERNARISRLAEAGIAMAKWNERTPIEVTLRQIEGYRGNIFRR